MFVPMHDDRYFTPEYEVILAQDSVPIYSAAEYEQEYVRISRALPWMFSVNLQREMTEFLTTVPSQFGVHLETVMEVACYYYCDWETVNALTDEFINADTVERVRKSLQEANYSGSSADEMLQDLIVMLAGALRRLMKLVVNVLTRVQAPSIMDYGCCYRLFNVDDFGNVFFNLRGPSEVYAELAGEETKDRQHCG